MISNTLNTIGRLFVMAAFLAATVNLAGCDPSVDPKSEASESVVFADDQSYESYLAKLYGGLNVTGQIGPAGAPDIPFGDADEGFSQYLRAYWQLQQLPTDEAVLAWEDDEGVPELNFQTWTPENPFLRIMYDRVFFQIAHSNEFLSQTVESRLDDRGVSADVRRQIPQFRAEARFLRALSYWHGLDLFANIPLVDEDFVRGAEPPEQSSPEEIFPFLEQELLEITGEVEGADQEEVLPAMGEAEYGRADRGAAYMLLAKLYQNAEVYIGENRSDDVVEFTSRIIESGAYSLEPTYHDLFLADNAFSDEFIFAIPHDGDRTRHFGGTTFLGNASLGPFGDEFGLQGWFGLRTLSPSVDRYGDSDLRPVFPNTPGDQFFRELEGEETRSKDIQDFSDFDQGFVVPKYQNVTSDGEPGASSLHSDVDYPKFRLADAYLMYAEAVLRGGGGSVDQAVSLINDLRDRAFEGNEGLITEADLDLDFILDERSRELLWEAQRRVDLIRFGQFSDEGVWPFKGGTQEGATTDPRRDLYPIPSPELRANPNLDQNPGY